MNDLFFNEVSCLSKFKHPNILKVLSYSEKSQAKKPNGKTIDVMYLALEYAENGEIFDYIAETGSFGEPVARYYFHQLISALEYLHNMGYYHRDVKPENILLDKDFNLKLADFGFTTTSEVSESRKGTFGYMAPEVLAKKPYKGAEADLFASAVILFILLSQHPPFIRAEEGDRYYKKIIQDKWDKFWKVYEDENFTEAFKDLFSKMVSPSPHLRLTLQEIKEHEWFNGPVASPEEILKEFRQRQVKLRKVKEDKAKPKQKIKFDDNDTASSENKSTRKTKKSKAIKRKYTRFFKVEDADELIDAVIDVAQQKGFGFTKSEEFFRVNLHVAEDQAHVEATINVLKAPDEDMRCLEFILDSGDRELFDTIFTICKRYCRSKFI